MPSLRDSRRWFARTKLRRYRPIISGVQAASPYGSYVGIAAGDLATNGDELRTVVSSDLASRGLVTGPDVRGDWYDGWYALALADRIEQRRISLEGFTPAVVASSVTDQVSSVYVGYVVTERNFGAAIPPGTVVELHAHPPQDADGVPGLHTFMNQALKGMRAMTRRVTLTALDGVQSYSLAAYGVTRQWQLGQVLGPSGSGQEPYSAAGAAMLRTDGAVTYLVFRSGAPTASTFYADLWLPRDSWIVEKRKASANVTVTAGAVTAITLVDGGVGYDGVATVAIVGAGTGASATVTVAGGAVTGFSGLVGGSGYASGTTYAVISAPTSTTYAISAVGLVNDMDESTGDINEIALAAYYHYCEYRAIGPDGSFDAVWAGRAKKAAEVCAPFFEFGDDMVVDAWGGGQYGALIERGGAGSDWGLGGGSAGVPSWP